MEIFLLKISSFLYFADDVIIQLGEKRKNEVKKKRRKVFKYDFDVLDEKLWK